MLRFCAIGAVVLVSAARLAAFEIGDTVAIIDEAELKIESQSVGRLNAGYCLKVEAVNGDWLWTTTGKAGWIESRRVLTLEEAQSHFTRAIVNHPRVARWYFARAIVRGTNGDFDEAIGDLNQAIVIEPRAAYYGARANISQQRGNYEQAIEDYDRAVRLNSQDAAAYQGRGAAYTAIGDHLRAIADYDRAITLDPRLAAAWTGRGTAWRLQGDNTRALADMTKAIELDPTYSTAYKQRGYLHYFRGEYELALVDLQLALQCDPRNPKRLCDLAWVWAACPDARHRNPAKAIVYAKMACEMTGGNSLFGATALAAAYAESGDISDAIKYQSQANRLPGDDVVKEAGEHRLNEYMARQREATQIK